MKALVLAEYGRFVLEDRPVPQPGPGEVLVRVRACAICGSDVHGLDGRTGRRIPPIVMGHEAAGEIAAVGNPAEGSVGTAAWRPGDRVTFDSTIYCGACEPCRQGRINLCDHRRVLGVSCAEYRQDGAFAEYVVVPARILHRLPDAVSFVQAALVEPLAVALHAVRRAPLRPGDAVAVVGAGMIGLLLIQLLRDAGCRRILAVDLDPGRLEKARRAGATDTIQAKGSGTDPANGTADASDPAEEIRRRTGGGVHAAFDAVGLPASLATSVASLRKGGTLVLVGNLSPEVPLPLQAVVTRELSLLGSCASAGEYPDCLERIASGRVDVTLLLSATAPLEEGPAWFARLHAGDPGLMKVVLTP